MPCKVSESGENSGRGSDESALHISTSVLHLLAGAACVACVASSAAPGDLGTISAAPSPLCMADGDVLFRPDASDGDESSRGTITLGFGVNDYNTGEQSICL